MAGDSYWGLTARPCDSCKGSPAVLFCLADSAYLCGACDARVHGANPLASRHGRVWLCELCEQAPASVTCKADAATLCSACDADIHAANPLSSRHERFPILPFYEPSAAIKPSSAAAFIGGDKEGGESEAATSTWMVSGHGGGEKVGLDLNSFFADVVDPYSDLDYASGDGLVPLQGKPVVGGGFGGEAPPMMVMDAAAATEIDFAIGKPSYGSSYNGHSLSHSVSSSEVGVVPDSGGGAMADVSNPYGRLLPDPAVVMDRQARVMRYREKRKNRKFEKTIRYASRKAYAETRPRIKGRFAKRVVADSEAEPIYTFAAVPAAAAVFMVDSGYGVVPSI